ncbi:hypothetical protein AALO_G00144070 [Alosa alosa]|uniref:Uncharacterized protein n=1 Tax=Alosa alosa TaxID=278164 RepID=A0AAV6GJ64_9TELE|nr:hypothetical protein AALO_G00144070 [Alosa alosa]
MSGWQVLGVVGILILSLLLMAVGYVMYSGLFSEINIRTGSPPMRNITIAYKFKQGPYKDCGPLFTECSKLGPKLSTIGVFYDDPKKVPGPLCRCAVGSVLSEAVGAPCAETQLRYEAAGFRLFSFPEVTHAVCASFPHRTSLSIFLGVQRVYPQLDAYIKKRQLCAHPFLEVYSGQLIHYMSPLARQDGFYVPEVREAERRRAGDDDDEEDDEDDGTTIVSGTGSYSQCSSPVQLCDSHSPHSSGQLCDWPALELHYPQELPDSPGQHYSTTHRSSPTPCSTSSCLPLLGRGEAPRAERSHRSSPSPFRGLDDVKLKVHTRSCQTDLLQERGMATEGEE